MTANLETMTMTEYIGMAKELMTNMVKRLPEPVDTTILVVGKENIFHFVMTGEVPNNARAKSGVVALAKEAVKRENASAVLIFGDLWLAEAPIEDEKLRERIDAIGLEEAGRLGLVKHREALWCKIMTRTQGEKVFLQFYRRENGGRDIVIEEAKEPAFQMGVGRMSDFFPPLATA